MQSVAASGADAAFKAQSSIVQPDLRADVKTLDENEALVQGSTEKGNRVTINGKTVKVMGNGGFLKRLSLQPGKNIFTIISTDRHGGVSTVVRSINLGGNTVVADPSAADLAATHCAVPSNESGK